MVKEDVCIVTTSGHTHVFTLGIEDLRTALIPRKVRMRPKFRDGGVVVLCVQPGLIAKSSLVCSLPALVSAFLRCGVIHSRHAVIFECGEHRPNTRSVHRCRPAERSNVVFLKLVSGGILNPHYITVWKHHMRLSTKSVHVVRVAPTKNSERTPSTHPSYYTHSRLRRPFTLLPCPISSVCC